MVFIEEDKEIFVPDYRMDYGDLWETSLARMQRSGLDNLNTKLLKQWMSKRMHDRGNRRL